MATKKRSHHKKKEAVQCEAPAPVVAAPTPAKQLTTHEAAKLVGCNPSSIVKWINDGKLRSYHTPGGHRRVMAADLKAFVESTGGFVAPALAAAAA